MSIKIGGEAANDGVTFYGSRYVVTFTMNNRGETRIKHRKQIDASRMKRYLARIPIVKGFAVLFGRPLTAILASLSLATELITYSGIIGNTSTGAQTAVTIAICAAVLGVSLFVIKKHVFKVGIVREFHGAEHKVAYALDHSIPLTLENVRRCPRTATRCGTNIVVFMVFFVTVFSFFIPLFSVMYILAFVLAYELFDIDNAENKPVIKWFFYAGFFFQNKLFTSEPTDERLQAAIDAARSLVELENGS